MTRAALSTGTSWGRGEHQQRAALTDHGGGGGEASIFEDAGLLSHARAPVRPTTMKDMVSGLSVTVSVEL